MKQALTGNCCPGRSGGGRPGGPHELADQAFEVALEVYGVHGEALEIVVRLLQTPALLALFGAKVEVKQREQVVGIGVNRARQQLFVHHSVTSLIIKF